MSIPNIYSLLRLIIKSLIIIIFITQMSYGAYLNLTWNANTEEDLAGYKVYYGTLSGNYETTIDVENITEYKLADLKEGITYYIALTAYDNSNNESEKSDEVSGVAKAPPDIQNPTINVTAPTSYSTYSTSNSTINIGGTASDNVDVTSVTWSNKRGGRGSAFGTTNWTIYNISLKSGQNIIIVTATDAAGNTGTDTITITYTPSTTSTTSTIASSTTTTVVSITTSTTTPVTTTTVSPSTTTSVAPITTTTPVTTTILPDTTPPSGTISINNGDKLTHSPNVTLTLFATDDGEELGGDALMTFSNDNQEWSDPEPYTVIKMWTLTPDKGDKTVYVKFRDAAGNWMTEPAKDQIRFEESEEICDDPYKLQPAYVAASSEFLPFREKDKAVDGNYLTFWSTPPSLYRKNEFITLDLGEIKQMSRIDMYALKFLTMDFFPVNFQIQLSSDNINWEEIRSEKNYTLKSTHFDSWELNSLEARYLRVSITKAKTFFIFYVAQIAEIEVYGCDIPEQNFAPLDDTASIKDAEPGDTLPEEGGEAAELDQAPPSVPGRPVITFN